MLVCRREDLRGDGHAPNWWTPMVGPQNTVGGVHGPKEEEILLNSVDVAREPVICDSLAAEKTEQCRSNGASSIQYTIER